MLPHAATVTRLRALFARSRSSVARSDKNKDGFIDGAELRELLTRGGNSDTKGSAMTEDDCTALISSFDDNGDGKLSIEEVRARLVALEEKYWSTNLARPTRPELRLLLARVFWLPLRLTTSGPCTHASRVACVHASSRDRSS